YRTRQYIRRRVDRFPRPAFRFFGSDDHRKHRRFSSTTRESEKFKPEFKKFLHGGDVQNLLEAARQHQNSHVAQVVSAGIIEYDGVAQSGGDASASFDVVTSAIRDSISDTMINLKK